jgi:ATP/maltotriose-dependent transcriptional regulator MalT
MVEPMYATFRSFGTGEASFGEVEMPVDDPDPWIAGVARVMRAHVELNFGRSHAEAELDFQRALAVFGGLGERWGTAFSLTSLATLAGWRGDFGPAIAFGEEAVRCVVELGAVEDEVEFRVKQVQVLFAGGQPGRARAELALADRTAQRLGVAHVRSRVASVAGDLARFEGDLVLAADLVRRAEELLPERGVAPQFQSILASSRGYLEAARGDLDEAWAHHRRAVQLAVSSFDAPIVAQALIGLAEVALDDGDAGLAATVLGAGTGIRGRPDLSFVDGVRVAARAEAALGTAAFQRAYQRGLSATNAQIGELVGVEIPDVVALTSSA